MFGSSIASYRREGKKSYVKSVFHGAYRRKVFEDVGGFNEALGRTEDNELHYRIRRKGYKICFHPGIHSRQHVRSSRKKCAPEVQQRLLDWPDGRRLPKCLSLYHFVPFGFVCAIIGSGILALRKHKLPAKLLWGAYGTAASLMALLSVKNVKKHVSQGGPAGSVFHTSCSYGIGTLLGLVRCLSWRKTHGHSASAEEVKALLNAQREGVKYVFGVIVAAASVHGWERTGKTCFWIWRDVRLLFIR